MSTIDRLEILREKLTEEKNAYNRMYNMYVKKEQEIERLKEQLNDEIKEELKQSEIMVKKQQEIERLNTNWEVAIEDLSKIAKLLDLEEGCTIYDIENKIERLNNIIKEVREYIEEKYDYILGDDTFLDHDERIERKQIDHILEILDKERR